ncbi:SDR family oxidoreductase [Larkinella punicea]|uniref:SDR family NAD(P)-dependent oxidoreductase n=1 Tax=Larkinella punicea TaxID=2315727 RepID=A0A368JVT2_9BACT|nr:SDR family oxidoreductase [Larkinella punicea]RCR70693.1 SDR family NAD(P)-dependent oxidoreductase [Larkinella punicea]
MTQSISPSILITGATGTIGSELATQLSAKGIPFRALVRSLENAEKLAQLDGAELVVGDLNDPESLVRALDGIERAFLLTNSSEQAETLQMNFVAVAQQAGVKHIVKLSQFAADLHSPVRFLRYHAAVEQKIRESGLSFTFLRPNLFMQALLGFRDPIVNQGKFFATAGDARISAVDIRDIAAVAVEALTMPGHVGKTYDLTGPEALTHQQMAAHFSDILGRPVLYIDVPPAHLRQALLSVGFPEWQADGLIEDYAHYARGEASAVSSAIQEVTGKPARDFKSFVRDYALVFS